MAGAKPKARPPVAHTPNTPRSTEVMTVVKKALVPSKLGPTIFLIPWTIKEPASPKTAIAKVSETVGVNPNINKNVNIIFGSSEKN